MSKCIICGEKVDISQDLCHNCVTASFWLDLGNGLPMMEQELIKYERLKEEHPDQAEQFDPEIGRLKRQIAALKW